MASLNKVMIIGNLGRDPEMRVSPDQGFSVCNLNIATTRYWNDRQTNTRKSETEWHRVTLYNRQADLAGQYLRKGSGVYIEGRLRTRKWQDAQGNDRFTTEIVGEAMQFLGGAQGDQSMSGGDQYNDAGFNEYHQGGMDAGVTQGQGGQFVAASSARQSVPAQQANTQSFASQGMPPGMTATAVSTGTMSSSNYNGGVSQGEGVASTSSSISPQAQATQLAASAPSMPSAQGMDQQAGIAQDMAIPTPAQPKSTPIPSSKPASSGVMDLEDDVPF